MFLSGILLQLNHSFESVMGSAGLLPLGKSGLTNRGNIYTWCWCILVDALTEEGNYCMKISLLLVWVHPFYGNSCGQLVTSGPIQQV